MCGPLSYLPAVSHYGLRDCQLGLAAQHGGAGALVAAVALLEGDLGARGEVLAGGGGGGGEDQGLQGQHLRLQHVNLAGGGGGGEFLLLQN